MVSVWWIHALLQGFARLSASAGALIGWCCCLQTDKGAAATEQMASLFTLAYRCLLHAPGVLLSSGMLQPLLGGALQVCKWREADPLRAALIFISVFLDDQEEDPCTPEQLTVLP
jgi:hypothetical protein